MKIAVLLVTFSFVINGCSSLKPLFVEHWSDGSRVSGNEVDHKDSAGSGFVVSRSRTPEKKVYEYRFPLYGCDKILKVMFEREKTTTLIVTQDINPSYPINEDDRRIFEKMRPVLENKNSCYVYVLKGITGFKLLESGSK